MSAWRLFKLLTRLLVVLLIGGAYWLLFTPAGNQRLITELAGRYEFQAEGVEGSLKDTLCVSSFYMAPTTSARLEAADLCLDIDVLVSLVAGYPRLHTVTARRLTVTFEPEPSPADELLPAVTLPVIPLRARIGTLRIDQLEINDQVIRQVSIDDARIAPFRSRIARLAFDTADVSVDTSLTIDQSLQVDHLEALGQLDVGARHIAYSLKGGLNAVAVEVSTEEGRVEGRAEITTVNWPFDVQLAINPRTLPSIGLEQPVSGELNVKGDALNLDFSGHLATADGQIAVDGGKRRGSLETDLGFTDFPLALQQWQGLLDGKAHVKSDLVLNQFDISLSDFQSPVTPSAVSGRASISLQDDAVRISSLQLASGEGKVAGQGQYTSATDWQVNAAIDNLTILYGALSLRVTGEVDATSDATRLKLAMQDVTFEDFRSDTLTIDLDLSRPEWLHLDARGLWAMEQELGSVALTLRGDSDHSEFEVAGGIPILEYEASGQIDRETDRLVLLLESLALKTSDETIGPAPFIRLLEPSAITLSYDGNVAGSLALSNRFGGDAKLTLDTTADQAALQVNDWQIPDYPVAGTDYRLAAIISGDLATQTLAGAAWSGNLMADRIRIQGLPANFPDLDTESGSINLVLDSPGSHTAIDINGAIPELLKVVGQVVVSARDSVRGNLDLTLLYPELLSPFLAPWASGPTGNITAQLGIDSSADSNPLTGSVDWTNGGLDIELLGLSLSAIEVELSATDGEDIAVNATARESTGQPIEVTGSVNGFSDSGPSVDLAIRSTEALLVNRSDARARISSDVKYRYAQDIHNLSGTLKVHKANYTLGELPPTAVLPSADVEVLGRTTQSSAQQLKMDIMLEFSPATYLEAYGLKTNLSGKLNYVSSPGEPAILRGELNTHEGTFEIYGQALSITRGQLKFDGPLDDPLVDVIASRAVRADGQNYLVSVNVQGYATELTTNITSSPALPEADALSLLLTGRLLAQTGDQEQLDVAAAALSLGLKGSAFLTDRIASLTGLHELTVSSSADGIEVGAGRQIGENLFLRYTYGSFSRIGGILVDYEITENLRLRANTGDTESLELQYIFPQ